MIRVGSLEQFVVAVMGKLSTNHIADVVHELLELFSVYSAVVVFVVSDPQFLDDLIVFNFFCLHLLKKMEIKTV